MLTYGWNSNMLSIPRRFLARSVASILSLCLSNLATHYACSFSQVLFYVFFGPKPKTYVWPVFLVLSAEFSLVLNLQNYYLHTAYCLSQVLCLLFSPVLNPQTYYACIFWLVLSLILSPFLNLQTYYACTVSCKFCLLYFLSKTNWRVMHMLSGKICLINFLPLCLLNPQRNYAYTLASSVSSIFIFLVYKTPQTNYAYTVPRKVCLFNIFLPVHLIVSHTLLCKLRVCLQVSVCRAFVWPFFTFFAELFLSVQIF